MYYYFDQLRIFKYLSIGNFFINGVDRKGSINGVNPVLFKLFSAVMSVVVVLNIFLFTNWIPDDYHKFLKYSGISVR
jgi:hypothetical protein